MMNGESKQRRFRSVLPEKTRTKDENEDDCYTTLNRYDTRPLPLML